MKYWPDDGQCVGAHKCGHIKDVVECHDEIKKELSTLKADVLAVVGDVLKQVPMLRVQDVKALLTLKKKVGG